MQQSVDTLTFTIARLGPASRVAVTAQGNHLSLMQLLRHGAAPAKLVPAPELRCSCTWCTCAFRISELLFSRCILLYCTLAFNFPAWVSQLMAHFQPTRKRLCLCYKALAAEICLLVVQERATPLIDAAMPATAPGVDARGLANMTQ